MKVAWDRYGKGFCQSIQAKDGIVETILVLAVAAMVFGLFFLVFMLKGTSKDRPARFHTCGKCNCHGSETLANRQDGSTAKEEPCHSNPSGIS